jgi:hypothetical protein
MINEITSSLQKKIPYERKCLKYLSMIIRIFCLCLDHSSHAIAHKEIEDNY